MVNFKTLISAAFLVGTATLAQACPDYGQSGATFSYSGGDLYSARSFSVTAGGGNNLNNCGFNGAGYVTTAPDFTFNLSGMGAYSLVISVNSNCDAMLLVNDANGSWYYDDDSNGNSDPRLQLNGMDGWLDVWVGTYNGSSCAANLSLETF